MRMPLVAGKTVISFSISGEDRGRPFDVREQFKNGIGKWGWYFVGGLEHWDKYSPQGEGLVCRNRVWDGHYLVCKMECSLHPCSRGHLLVGWWGVEQMVSHHETSCQTNIVRCLASTFFTSMSVYCQRNCKILFQACCNNCSYSKVPLDVACLKL